MDNTIVGTIEAFAIEAIRQNCDSLSVRIPASELSRRLLDNVVAAFTVRPKRGCRWRVISPDRQSTRLSPAVRQLIVVGGVHQRQYVISDLPLRSFAASVSTAELLPLRVFCERRFPANHFDRQSVTAGNG